MKLLSKDVLIILIEVTVSDINTCVKFYKIVQLKSVKITIC